MSSLENDLHIKRGYVISLMISMAFIPILQNVYQNIRISQTMRGAEFLSGTISERIKGLASILITIFRFALQKTEILGEAITIKGYSQKQ